MGYFQEARSCVVKNGKHTIARQVQHWFTFTFRTGHNCSSLLLLTRLPNLVLLLCRTSIGSPTEDATVRLGVRAHSGGTHTGSPVDLKGLPQGSPVQTQVLPSLKMLQTPPNQQLQGIPTQVRPVGFRVWVSWLTSVGIRCALQGPKYCRLPRPISNCRCFRHR